MAWESITIVHARFELWSSMSNAETEHELLRRTCILTAFSDANRRSILKAGCGTACSWLDCAQSTQLECLLFDKSHVYGRYATHRCGSTWRHAIIQRITFLFHAWVCRSSAIYIFAITFTRSSFNSNWIFLPRFLKYVWIKFFICDFLCKIIFVRWNKDRGVDVENFSVLNSMISLSKYSVFGISIFAKKFVIIYICICRADWATAECQSDKQSSHGDVFWPLAESQHRCIYILHVIAMYMVFIYTYTYIEVYHTCICVHVWYI